MRAQGRAIAALVVLAACVQSLRYAYASPTLDAHAYGKRSLGQAGPSKSLSEGSVHCHKCLTVVLPTHFDDLARATLTIHTAVHHLPAASISEFVLIVPEEESYVLTTLLGGNGGFTAAYPTRVLSENRVLNMSEAEIQRYIRGKRWFAYKLQMVLKIWIAKELSTEFYLVLDADVMVARPLTPQELFPQPGKARYVEEPRGYHPDWWETTEAVFNLTGIVSTDTNAKLFGVTPAILSRQISLKAVQYIEGLWKTDRYEHLLQHRHARHWTEYTLYRIIAEKYGLFERFHAKGEGKWYRGWWGTDSDTAAKWADAKKPRELCKDTAFCLVQSTRKMHPRRIFRLYKEVFINTKRQGY